MRSFVPVVLCALCLAGAARAAPGADATPASAGAPADGLVVDAGPPPAQEASGAPPPVSDDTGTLVPPPTTSDMVMPMVKAVLALGVVVLLAWLTLHKGMGRLIERAQAGKRMKVVERVSLDARRSLFLVEVDGRALVIGGGDLVRLDVAFPDDVAADAARRVTFDKVLAAQVRSPSTTPPPATPAEPA